MLPPPITVVGSAESGLPIWLSYTTSPVRVIQIFIRSLSCPPPPGSCPSIAVRRKEYPSTPLIVPWPLYWHFGPPQTSQSYDVLWKFRSATLNANSVSPVGTLAPFWYFASKPKVAFPVRVGLSAYAPGGESIHPPPVTKPPFGSYTTTMAVSPFTHVEVPTPPSSSSTVRVTSYTPGAVKV